MKGSASQLIWKPGWGIVWTESVVTSDTAKLGDVYKEGEVVAAGG